ncbi:MAG: hypothetical protein RLZZ59_736 [Pseudomonadota bacterium]|jgi:hypothetical protein
MYKNYSYSILNQEAQAIFGLNQIKKYLRVSDDDDDDQIIMDMLESCIQVAENFTKISLINRSIEVAVLDSDYIKLPKLPFLRFVDIRGNGETILQDAVELFGNKLSVKEGIIYDELKVSYLSGYADSRLVPSPLKQAILIHLSNIYDARGGSLVCPESSLAIYSTYRKMEI